MFLSEQTMKRSLWLVTAGVALLSFPHVVIANTDIAAQPTINGKANPNYDPNYAENKAWLQKIAPSVRASSQKYGIHGSIQMAQAVLESGWGKSSLSTQANNFFGIKGSADAGSVIALTWEYNGSYRPNWEYKEPVGTAMDGKKITGKTVKIPYGQSAQVYARFAKYKSFSSSLDYNGSLIRNGLSWDPSFYAGAWKENAATYVQAARALQGKYATDSTYASKLIRLIENYNMEQMVNVTLTTPTFTRLNAGDRVITGQAAPGSRVTLSKLSADSKVLSSKSTTAKSDGTYTIQIVNAFAHGQRVQVTSSLSGQGSRTTRTSVGIAGQITPTFTRLNADDRVIQGRATPNSRVTLSRMSADSKILSSKQAYTDANGNFSISIVNAFAQGQRVHLKSELGGYVATEKRQSVGIAGQTTPTFTRLNAGDRVIQGRATPNSRVTLSKISPTGQILSSKRAYTDANGRYSITIVNPFAQGQRVHVLSELAGYAAVEKYQSVGVVHVAVPTFTQLKAGNPVIKGKTTPNSYVTIGIVGSAHTKSAYADANGNFTITIVNPFRSGTKVQASSALTGYKTQQATVVVQ